MNPAAPFVYVIVGAPGTGKSSQIRITLGAGPLRAIVFDPMGEYGGVMVTLDGMRRSLLAAGLSTGFCLIYRPYTEDLVKLKQRFDVFCKLAFAAGDLLCVVDEAADVTSPNRYEVPEGWSTLLKQGRHRAVRIIAGTQRPADVDKRLWTFATRIRTGRLNYSSDQAELANVLNVDRAEVAALVERQWIERDMLTGAITRGSIEWRRNTPYNVPRLTSRQTSSPDTVRPARNLSQKPLARPRTARK
jgi:hypothetical protein